MEFLKSLMTNKYFWILFIAFVASLVIMLFGDNFFKFLALLSTRVLVGSVFFIFVLSVVLIILLINAKQKNSQNNDEIQRIKEMEARNKKEVELQLKGLKAKFDFAITTLQKSVHYKAKRNAKYELPWYFIIGDEDSVKTNLIKNSGLNFPLNQDEINKPNQLEQFHWYFTEEAVLIDVHSKYINNEIGSVEHGVWKGFLKLFKTRRWKRPINGIILPISAELFINSEETTLDSYTKKIRDKFDDLSSVFTASIPIYIIITQCEAFSGFTDYFAMIDEDEKDEIFGLTFDESINIDGKVFQKEFDLLIKRVESSLIDRVNYHWEKEERRRALVFADNLYSIADKLRLFIDAGFAQTRYRAPLMLRSLFLSSVHQYFTQKNSKGLFTLKAFKEFIFQESNIVKMDYAFQSREQIKERIIMGGCIAILLLSLGFMVNDYYQHKQTIDYVNEQLEIINAKKMELLGNDDVMSRIDRLDSIYNIKEMTYDKTYSFYNLASSLGNERMQKSDKLYHVALEAEILTFVEETLREELSNSLDDYDATWDNTKAYLMLNMVDKRDNQFLSSHLASIWTYKYRSNPVAYQKLIQYWDSLLKQGFQSYTIDSTTLQDARNSLVGLSKEELVYKQLKDNAMRMNFEDFSFNQVLKENSNILQDGGYVVPGLFTQKGYQSVFNLDGKAMIKQLISTNWIIGFPVKVDDTEIDAVYAKVEKYYLNEYKSVWLEALHSVVLSKKLSPEQITILTSQNSPIVLILSALKENTEIYSASELADKKLGQISQMASKVTQKFVNTSAKSLRDYFRSYNVLITNENLANGILQTEMDRCKNLFVKENAMIKAEPTKETFQLVVSGANLNDLSKNEISQLPKPLNYWLPNYDISVAAPALVQQAKQYVQNQYATQLYPFYYEKIANKYPFNYLGTEEVILTDFEEFFSSGGLLDSFYKEYIAPFVAINSSGIGYKDKKNDADMSNILTFNKQFLEAIYVGNDIRKSLFNPKNGLGTAVYIKPNILGNNLSSMVFQYEDKSIVYEHGPIKSTKFSWPATSANQNIKIQYYDLNNQNVATTTTDGQWALFRLIDKMKVSNLSNDEINIEYEYQGHKGSMNLSGTITKTIGNNSIIKQFKLPKSI